METSESSVKYRNRMEIITAQYKRQIQYGNTKSRYEYEVQHGNITTKHKHKIQYGNMKDQLLQI